jgi:hypothetical protein
MRMYLEFVKGKKYGLPNAKTSVTHKDFTDCGFLLTDEIVVVDIDEMEIEQIKKVMNFYDIQTMTVFTNRGVHWFWIKPLGFIGNKSNNVTLNCPIEYKHSSNVKATCIKQNGVLRRIENEGIYQPLPEWLYPPKVKRTPHKPYKCYLNFTILYGCTKLLKDKGIFDDEYAWSRYTWAIGTLYTDGALTPDQCKILCESIDCGDKSTFKKFEYGLNRYNVSFGHIHTTCMNNDVEYIKYIKMKEGELLKWKN